jgi:hypothetical protein
MRMTMELLSLNRADALRAIATIGIRLTHAQKISENLQVNPVVAIFIHLNHNDCSTAPKVKNAFRKKLP